jgi:hypothetical protein
MYSKLILCLSFATALCAQTEYFPLQTGNQWLYQTAGYGCAVRSLNDFCPVAAETWTLEIVEERMVDGVNHHVLRGLPGGDRLLRFNEAGTLLFRRANGSEEQPWASFGAPVGEAWATAIDPCNNVAVIRSKDATVRTLMGQFDNTLEIGYQPANCADAGLTREVFAPNIGLLERRFTTIAGERVMQLVHARLGGFHELSGPEWNFSAALDRAVYSPGATITARFTLRNLTGNPVELTFPSGQDYDLLLFDGDGKEVYRWSDGRAFTMIFRQIAFSGERSWLLVTPMPQLPPGDYMAILRLATQPRIETTLPVRIEAAQP